MSLAHWDCLEFAFFVCIAVIMNDQKNEKKPTIKFAMNFSGS